MVSKQSIRVESEDQIINYRRLINYQATCADRMGMGRVGIDQ